MIVDMGFLRVQGRKYYPKHIMFRLILENGVGYYKHEVDPILDKVANLKTLEQVLKVLRERKESGSTKKNHRNGSKKSDPKVVLNLEKE